MSRTSVYKGLATRGAKLSTSAQRVARLGWGVALATSVLAASPAYAQNDAPVRPDAARGEQLYVNGDAARNITACVACHGAQGNSTSPLNPILAGQHAGYTYKQLRDYQVASGAESPARVNGVMNAIAAPLTSQDMRDIAAYLEAQTKVPSAASNPEYAELGQRIWRAGVPSKAIPACAACHGPAGSGVPNQYPRLAGQYADYTAAQLIAWRAGERKNNVAMEQISYRMSDLEIRAVADFIAGLR